MGFESLAQTHHILGIGPKWENGIDVSRENSFQSEFSLDTQYTWHDILFHNRINLKKT